MTISDDNGTRAAPSPDVDTSYTAAVVQMEPHVGDISYNMRRSCEWVECAGEAGASLVVLPEACSAGYVFADRAEALRYAEEIPGGPVTSAWAALAARRKMWIVGGVTERGGDAVYNSAVLISPSGLVRTFRKAHLWNDEKRIYEPTTTPFPVFDTPLGRIGFGICYDAWFPETFRSAAVRDADLVVLPSNWVPVPGQPATLPTMANMMCLTAAHSNQIYVLAASRIGVERGVSFVGRSLIVGPDGWPIGGPASLDAEELVTARIDPVGTRGARAGNPFNQPLRDRRPELYALTGPDSAPTR